MVRSRFSSRDSVPDPGLDQDPEVQIQVQILVQIKIQFQRFSSRSRLRSRSRGPDPGSDPCPDQKADPGSDPVPDPGSDPVQDNDTKLLRDTLPLFLLWGRLRDSTPFASRVLCWDNCYCVAMHLGYMCLFMMSVLTPLVASEPLW